MLRVGQKNLTLGIKSFLRGGKGIKNLKSKSTVSHWRKRVKFSIKCTKHTYTHNFLVTNLSHNGSILPVMCFSEIWRECNGLPRHPIKCSPCDWPYFTIHSSAPQNITEFASTVLQKSLCHQNYVLFIIIDSIWLVFQFLRDCSRRILIHVITIVHNTSTYAVFCNGESL